MSCLPFFLIPNNNWDGVIYDYAFSINDFSIIEYWYKISRINFQLFLANALYFLYHNLNLSYDIVFDVFTTIAFILYIYEINIFCKKTFNLASPKQLGEILFDDLKLESNPKKTKTGQYSTSEETLSKLSKKHEIVTKILDWRSLQKLMSTYINALPHFPYVS